MLDRRLFLKSSGLALVAGGFLPGVFVRMAEAGTPPSRRVLVAIFQRGAVDGLNVLVPYGEKTYYDARPTIAVPRPGSGGKAAHRPRRLLRTASVARAASPVLPGPLGRLRPRRRQPRRDALALRRPGLHGVGHAGHEVDRRRLPRARARQRSRPRRPRRCARSRCRPEMPRILAGSSGAIAMTSLADFGIRAAGASRGRRPVLRVHVRGRGRRARSRPRRRSRSRRCGSCARPTRRGSRRPTAPTIRAARSGNRCGRSRSSSRRTSAWRSRSRTSAAGTRTPAKRASSPTRLRRLRPRDRRLREGPRLADGRRHPRHDVRVRPHGEGERESRHRPRPRQLHAAARRRRARRQGLRPVAGPRRLAPLRKPRPRRHDRLPRRLRGDPVRPDGRVRPRPQFSRATTAPRPDASASSAEAVAVQIADFAPPDPSDGSASRRDRAPAPRLRRWRRLVPRPRRPEAEMAERYFSPSTRKSSSSSRTYV